MARKTFITYITLNTIFLLCAALHLLVPFLTISSQTKPPTVSNVARTVLLNTTPLTASLVVGILMLTSFLISLPTYFLKKNTFLLQIHTAIITICALLTLSIGLKIWFATLQTRANLATVWQQQSDLTQSTLQRKFQCCGYLGAGADYRSDETCNAASVVGLGSCQVPFSRFATGFLNMVFTSFFGFCALDVMLLLAVLCVVKERKEERRYALIDEKRRGTRH